MIPRTGAESAVEQGSGLLFCCVLIPTGKAGLRDALPIQMRR